MRYRCVFFAFLSTGAVTILLSGCGSTLIGGSSAASTPPTVTGVGVQVSGVAPNRQQEVQFSEAMDSASINTQSFQVADSTGKRMPGSVTYDSNFNTASFQPDPALQSGATYTATITTAATSASGMNLVAPYQYTFTTRASSDTSPISIKSVSPPANATCVSASSAIVVTFDETPEVSTVMASNFVVTGPSGPISVSLSTNVTTTEVVLAPTSPLPSGTITVTVSNVADLAGVKMASPYTWSFSTACAGSGGGAATTQYQALFSSKGASGQVTVDTKGNVAAQLKGATPNQTFTLQFCPEIPLKQSTSACFPVGTLTTDANGAGSSTAMFPKSGPWSGDFQLTDGSMTADGFHFVFDTAYGPGYISTLQPVDTVNQGSLLPQVNNAPQAPLESGTVTYSNSPAPNGSLLFVLTGAPPNATIQASEGGLAPNDYYSIGGTFKTDSAGDLTFSAAPSGQGGDIFDVGPQNGEAGWVGGFSVPQ